MFYKLMTAIDIYVFSRRLLSSFGSAKIRDWPTPNAKSIDLLRRLNKSSEHFLTVEMGKLMTDSDYERVVRDMDLPNLSIIGASFSEFQFTRANYEIAEISCMRELKYTSDEIAKWPRYMDLGISVGYRERVIAADADRLRNVAEILSAAMDF